MVVGIILQALSTAFLLKTACRDPGTIPNRVNFLIINLFINQQEFLMKTRGKAIDQVSNTHFNWLVVLNSNLYKLKFCSTCMNSKIKPLMNNCWI